MAPGLHSLSETMEIIIMDIRKEEFPRKRDPAGQAEDNGTTAVGDAFDVGTDNVRNLPREEVFDSSTPAAGMGEEKKNQHRDPRPSILGAGPQPTDIEGHAGGASGKTNSEQPAPPGIEESKRESNHDETSRRKDG